MAEMPKRPSDDSAQGRMDRYARDQQGLRDWTNDAIRSHAAAIGLALEFDDRRADDNHRADEKADPLPSEKELRTELQLAGKKFDKSPAAMWRVLKKYYRASDAHLDALAERFVSGYEADLREPNEQRRLGQTDDDEPDPNTETQPFKTIAKKAIAEIVKETGRCETEVVERLRQAIRNHPNIALRGICVVTNETASGGDTAAQTNNVVDFEQTISAKVMAEAKRLAGLAPGEWQIWIGKRAQEIGVERSILEKVTKEVLKDREKKQHAKQAEARRQDQRAERQRNADERKRERDQQQILKDAERKEKEKTKALADIAKLPAAQHEAKLAELAKQIGEEVSSLRDEFVELVGDIDGGATTPGVSDIEPWPEPVTTVMVLEELIARINRHIKAKPHQVLCIALWVLTAWVHEVAAHYSVYLVATSPKEDCGKTTLIVDVVGRLVPKPYVSRGTQRRPASSGWPIVKSRP
jgi:hypothetical protein